MGTPVRIRPSAPIFFTEYTKMRTSLKYVLYYQPSADVAAKAPVHVAAHRARWQQFVSDGTLLMIGPFSNPREGAMGIFTTRAAAETFAAGDPFVLNGVIERWHVREWAEAIVPE